MKKILLAALALLLVASNSFAATGPGDMTASGSVTIGGSASTTEITIGLSPKVMGRYVTNGTTTTTAQWFAIATVHPGGNISYGTAQDLNNVYMKWFVTGTDPALTLATIPGTAPDTAAEGYTVGSDWVTLLWSTSTPTGPTTVAGGEETSTSGT